MSEIIEPKKLDDDDWTGIVNQITDKKCILFIGPETVLDSTGKSFHQELIKSASFTERKYFKYFERDEMFKLEKPYFRKNLVSAFKSYCNSNSFYDETYKKIAALPFHVIIVATRYPFIVKVFKNENFDFESRWFRKSFDNSGDELVKEDPGGENPLIYNLFGDFSNDDSLLLTHDDLFDYLKQMLNTGLPRKLIELVQSSTEIIFLGFKFERWYVQLLLRLFALNDERAKFERVSTNSMEDNDVVDICGSIFQMTFINNNIESFVSTLYDKCNAMGIKMRQPSAKPKSDSLTEKLNMLIESNKFSEALTEIEKIESAGNLPSDRTIGLRGQLKEIEDQEINDTERPDDLMRSKNKLRMQINLHIKDVLGKLSQPAL